MIECLSPKNETEAEVAVEIERDMQAGGEAMRQACRHASRQTDRQSYNHACNKAGRVMKADAGRHIRRGQVYKYTSHLSLLLVRVNRNPRISPIPMHIAYLLPTGKLFLTKHAFVTLTAYIT